MGEYENASNVIYRDITLFFITIFGFAKKVPIRGSN
ncbi:hypothetical protein SPACI_000130 [Sporomusa acidovorans DSM 3132]|uniref:Uncharacterized protein n=1 Tax=Sporomusa acidovorans (strain ATCC 49682 / DSM 3132 / Mol) TaxID=1123286 RepID=A0ABZ3IW14_SPOA4|nr:hypothetical protein SPACI_11800 [Sporomusa acidovorans DSM 3132]SDE76618.1 hypothetical protein SAMN04488499_10219 [Sporomusa acidovorans]